MTELQTMTFLDYYNENGDNLTFYYAKSSTKAEIQIDPDAVFRRVTIQNNPGYVQIFGNSANNNPRKNEITWFDKKNNIISANIR